MSLNDRIIGWLTLRQIDWDPGDFMTEINADGCEAITLWNTDRLGDMPCDGALDEAALAYRLATLQQQKWGQIREASLNVALVPYTTVAGIAALYQADARSQASVHMAISGCLKEAATPTGFTWIAADNTPVPFSYPDLLGLAEAMHQQSYATFKRLQQLKSTIAMATTEAEIVAVCW